MSRHRIILTERRFAGIDFGSLYLRLMYDNFYAVDRWTKKTGAKQTELAVYGWVAADQFVQGLKAAGPDFTRQKVIDALNTMKAYDASGLIPPIDWTVQHDNQVDTACQALTKIENGRFVPVFGSAGKPFICFRNLPAKLAEANVEPRA